MEVAEFLCPYRGGFDPQLKSCFFVICSRGKTLADGIGEPLAAIGGRIWYNTPKESEVIVCIRYCSSAVALPEFAPKYPLKP